MPFNLELFDDIRVITLFVKTDLLLRIIKCPKSLRNKKSLYGTWFQSDSLSDVKIFEEYSKSSAGISNWLKDYPLQVGFCFSRNNFKKFDTICSTIYVLCHTSLNLSEKAVITGMTGGMLYDMFVNMITTPVSADH